ncbi:DUF1889 family protein [Thioalkalivibrio sp. ALJ3]|uniref:DUF1889 family protein n=1 Tax=Thioalkalivibrio sp. ALJ3 TaxID=1240557 RepID=UPI0018CB4117|nr:DUF1889 family protein [Thioalkalivibrio sp. ALJ3]
MSPLVEEALISLTNRVNLSTGLLHYSDESAAKELFKLLHKEGEILNEDEIASWAAKNGWKDKHAKDLGELAGRMGGGGRVVVRNKGMWRDDIIDQLRQRANSNGA